MSSFAMNTTRRHLRLSSTTVSLMKLCAKSVTCACVGWTRDTCVHFTRPVTQSPHLNVSMLGEHETRAFISSDLRPSIHIWTCLCWANTRHVRSFHQTWDPAVHIWTWLTIRTVKNAAAGLRNESSWTEAAYVWSMSSMATWRTWCN